MIKSSSLNQNLVKKH